MNATVIQMKKFVWKLLNYILFLLPRHAAELFLFQDYRESFLKIYYSDFNLFCGSWINKVQSKLRIN